jgi:hypothetical protein
MSLRPSRLPTLLLALWLAGLAAGTSQLIPAKPISSFAVNATVDPTAQCGFQGDDNTYGLGIRIGIYLQWVTSAIAYTFLPEEGATMRGVNLCFLLSNFAGEVILSALYSRRN